MNTQMKADWEDHSLVKKYPTMTRQEWLELGKEEELLTEAEEDEILQESRKCCCDSSYEMILPLSELTHLQKAIENFQTKTYDSGWYSGAIEKTTDEEKVKLEPFLQQVIKDRRLAKMQLMVEIHKTIQELLAVYQEKKP